MEPHTGMVGQGGIVDIPAATGETMVDVEDYIESMLGPQQLPLIPLLPLTFTYALIWCIGIIGNIGTCIVVAKTSYLQTETNYYLLNLAITDVLTLAFVLPLELYPLWRRYPWPFGSFSCEMRTVVSESSGYASALTILLFTAERYIAICRPKHCRVAKFMKRTSLLIPVIWLVSVIAAVPIATHYDVNYLTDENEKIITRSAYCGFGFQHTEKSLPIMTGINSIVFFVIPFFIIAFLYACIFRTTLSTIPKQNQEYMEYQSIVLNEKQRKDQQVIAEKETNHRLITSQQKATNIVLRMLIVIVVIFFICWVPFHCQRMFFFYVSVRSVWTKNLKSLNEVFIMAAGILCYLNSAINPIIYCVMSQRYRAACRALGSTRLGSVSVSPHYNHSQKCDENSKSSSSPRICYCNGLNSAMPLHDSDFFFLTRPKRKEADHELPERFVKMKAKDRLTVSEGNYYGERIKMKKKKSSQKLRKVSEDSGNSSSSYSYLKLVINSINNETI